MSRKSKRQQKKDEAAAIAHESIAQSPATAVPLEPLAAVPAQRDSRKAPRERVVLSGTVVFSDGSFTVPCRIKDLSETGACVVVPPGLVIPTRHILIRTRARVVHVAKVARIASPEFGVQFTATHSLDGELPSNLQYLRRFR